MIKRASQKFLGWLKIHKWSVAIVVFVALGTGLIAVQLIWPKDHLLPFSSVDTVHVSGWSKADATTLLDQQYSQTPIGIYFGPNENAYRSPVPGDIGLAVSNTARVNASSYPWYARLIPTSIIWWHLLADPSGDPQYIRDPAVMADYIKKEFGEDCVIETVDATIKVTDATLVVQKGMSGGTCQVNDIASQLSDVMMQLGSETRVTVPFEVTPAAVKDSDAQKIADDITKNIADGVSVKVNDETVVVPAATVMSWLDFAVTDGKLVYSLNADRASGYLNETFAGKVTIIAGVTKIATNDFVETSRSTGVSGKSLDIAGTLANVTKVMNGDADTADVALTTIAPAISYSRMYSSTDTGLSALMKNYADTHPGTYGISLIELSGQRRRAEYHSTTQFTTASTYKLFVAYSTLKRIEDGSWKWTDQIADGRDLTECFDDMIVLSDNACAEAMLKKIGYSTVTNEAKAIGMTQTSFVGSNGIKTTSADLALLLAMLQSGQILNQQTNRDIWINAMKRNVYRQGIPKGLSGATVADKVGFLEGWLNDAAIVYAPSGTYVLTIMTENSSWANIAELAKQIEALRVQ